MEIFTFILITLFSFDNWLFDKLSHPNFDKNESVVVERAEENLMNIWYVDKSATGGNDGTNWGNAFTDLQQALNAAAENDEIWVAHGEYFPSRDTSGSNDPNSVLDFTFSVKEGVKIYGGFTGGEMSLDDRDPFANSTVLNGTLSGGETVKTVLRFIPEPFNPNNPVDFSQDELLIDGFQIMNSNTLDTATQNPVGGITFYTNYRDRLRVQNCLFLNHQHISKGGGIYAYGAETGLAQLTVFNCAFNDNRSNELGGGIYAGNCELDIAESVFQDNSAGTVNSPEAFDHIGGGAIAFESSSFWSNISFNVRNTDFFSNVVTFPPFVGNFNTFGGGALYVQSVSGSMSIDSCLFVQNSTGFGDGGALFLDLGKGAVGSGSFQLSNSDFFSNTATWNGGAIHVPSNTIGDLSFHNNHFNTNFAMQSGGAMYVNSSNFFDGILVDSSEFISNNSVLGGAIYFPHGENMTFTVCLFQGNSSLADGGAIASSNPGVGDVILNDCEFIGNSCAGFGGAVFNSAENVIAFETLFDQNTASGLSTRGGAIYSKGLELVNCIFSKNFAVSNGSGIYADGSSTLANCTFFNNSVASQLYFAFLTNMENCIVWTTTGASSVQLSNPDLFVAVNNNIIHGGFPGTNNKNIDPRFEDPDNGDFRLSACSPGVNSGNNGFISAFTDKDFDGNVRIFGGAVDMGAFENKAALGDDNHFFVRSGNEGDDGNRGISWDCAFSTIERAFEAADEFDTIWVAKGIYTPQKDISGDFNPGDRRQKTFFPTKNIRIFGGFGGNENPSTFNLEDRDFIQNETVLSGLLDTVGGGVKAYHIIFSEGLTDSTTIDGFTLSGSHANGGGIQNSGGAIFNVNSSPRIQNCIFKDNSAQNDGAGIAILGQQSKPKVRNCTFINNRSLGDDAGAVYSEGAPEFIDCDFLNNSSFDKGGVIRMISTDSNAVVFKNCLFSGNQGNQGGAVYNSGNLILENCKFDNNSAAEDGGSVYNEGNLKIRNGLITNSNAPNGGAIYHDYDDSFSILNILNTTIAGNSAGENNGIVQLEESDFALTITNSIIWGNNGVSILFESGGIYDFSHNLIENGCNENGINDCGGTNNFEGNPSFTDPVGGDFSLAEGSIAVNAGNNSAVIQADLQKDLNNISRIVDGTVDLGAYEFCDPGLGHDCETVVNSGERYFIDNQYVMFFPNPVDDLLNLKFEKPLLRNSEVELVTVTGQILKRKKFQKGDFEYQIDLRDIQPGYYFIKIESDKLRMTRGIMISR